MKSREFNLLSNLSLAIPNKICPHLIGSQNAIDRIIIRQLEKNWRVSLKEMKLKAPCGIFIERRYKRWCTNICQKFSIYSTKKHTLQKKKKQNKTKTQRNKTKKDKNFQRSFTDHKILCNIHAN